VLSAALDTHKVGVEDVLHIIRRLPDFACLDLDDLIEMVWWHLRQLEEPGVGALELQLETLDLFLL